MPPIPANNPATDSRCSGSRSGPLGCRSLAGAVLTAAEGSPLQAYVVLSLLSGARTEEVRALRWCDVDLTGDRDATRPVPPSVSVLRSVRQTEDTKTRKSRRRLAIPQRAVDALAAHRAALDHPPAADDLVFGTSNGTELDAHNVRRTFRRVADAAGLDPAAWTPRELRHSFVSLLSDAGMPLEQIARLLGHNGTAVTERVYRHQLRRYWRKAQPRWTRCSRVVRSRSHSLSHSVVPALRCRSDER